MRKSLLKKKMLKCNSQNYQTDVKGHMSIMCFFSEYVFSLEPPDIPYFDCKSKQQVGRRRKMCRQEGGRLENGAFFFLLPS